MTERLSTVQYANKTGMSKQLVLYYIKHNKPLAWVSRVEKVAGRNILHTRVDKLRKKVA